MTQANNQKDEMSNAPIVEKFGDHDPEKQQAKNKDRFWSIVAIIFVVIIAAMHFGFIPRP